MSLLVLCSPSKLKLISNPEVQQHITWLMLKVHWSVGTISTGQSPILLSLAVKLQTNGERLDRNRVVEYTVD